MHKIGVISDTHGLLRPEVLEILRECEVILHGGDINKQKILDELEEIAPVHVVRGNNDKEWAAALPESLNIELFGLKIFMVHNKKMIPANLQDVDLIIYGHSHRYEEKNIDGICYLNPGSCGPRRFTQPITLAVLTVEKGGFEVIKTEIPHGQNVAYGQKAVYGQNVTCGQKAVYGQKVTYGQKAAHGQKTGNNNSSADDGRLPDNLREMIGEIIKEIGQGKSVSRIAEKHKISEELAEQICRLYLTHPGVDEEGILRKMGL